MCSQVNGAPTWFFPLSINRLVTLPKGIPSETTSASDTSMGTLRTWRTREGPQGDRSPLYVLLSVPLAAKKGKKERQIIHFLILPVFQMPKLALMYMDITKTRPTKHHYYRLTDTKKVTVTKYFGLMKDLE